MSGFWKISSGSFERQIFVFFPLRTSSPVIIENSSETSLNPYFLPPTETILKYLSSLFSYRSFKLLLFWAINHEETRESLHFVTLFESILCIHAPQMSFVSYPSSDGISWKQRGGGSFSPYWSTSIVLNMICSTKTPRQQRSIKLLFCWYTSQIYSNPSRHKLTETKKLATLRSCSHLL